MVTAKTPHADQTLKSIRNTLGKDATARVTPLLRDLVELAWTEATTEANRRLRYLIPITAASGSALGAAVTALLLSQT